MAVFSNKISLLVLLKFFLLNKVLSQSLSIQSDVTSPTQRNFKEELSKRVKNRLNDYGSLKNYKVPESVVNPPKPSDSYLEKNLEEKKEESKPSVLADGPRTTETVHATPYPPREESNFLFSNFEGFLSKQSKEKLEKCAKAPHDFVLVVDESGSVSSYNWKAHVKVFVELVASAVAQLNADNNLSIVQFAESPKMVMRPRQVNKTNLPEALKVIDNMFGARRTHGTTYTGAALEFVRQEVLDPLGKFVVDLTDGKPPLYKENKIVILFTDGGTKDVDKAVKESLIARFNGVELFVFGIGSVKEQECRKLVGCSMEGECKNFIHADWNSVIEYLHELVFSMCRDSARNAICLENWSDYSECSVPCGGGVKTSKLLNFTTATEATQGPDGVRGLTCEEQFRNVSEKTLPCNEFPCPDTLVEINQHTPEEVPNKLQTKQYDEQGVAQDVEQQDEDTEEVEEEEEDEDKAKEEPKPQDRVKDLEREERLEQVSRDTTRLGRVLDDLRNRRHDLGEPRVVPEHRPVHEPGVLRTETEVHHRPRPESAEGPLKRPDEPLKAPEAPLKTPETTQNEVNERRGPQPVEVTKANALLKDFVNEDSEPRAPPFRILGQHGNVKVDHVLDQEELNRLDKPLRVHAGGLRPEEPRTELRNVVTTAEKSSQTVSKTDQTTQTKVAKQKTEGQQAGEPAEETKADNEPSNHSDQEVKFHDFTFKFNPQNLPNMNDLKKSLNKVEDKVLTFKDKLRSMLKNDNTKKIASVLIVILVSAVSISLFSYVFLSEKEPTQQLFDPADQDFMNAGDGDDVEPSENYQVSNMEDGIWA